VWWHHRAVLEAVIDTGRQYSVGERLWGYLAVLGILILPCICWCAVCNLFLGDILVSLVLCYRLFGRYACLTVLMMEVRGIFHCRLILLVTAETVLLFGSVLLWKLIGNMTENDAVDQWLETIISSVVTRLKWYLIDLSHCGNGGCIWYRLFCPIVFHSLKCHWC